VNPRRRALADSLYAASREHDDAQADRLARWRNVEPETAQLLGLLDAVARRRRAGSGRPRAESRDPARALVDADDPVTSSRVLIGAGVLLVAPTGAKGASG
jgi:hypothetical protein